MAFWIPVRTTRGMTAVVTALCLMMAGLEIASLASLPWPIPLGSLARQVALSWLPWFVGAPLIAWIGVRFRPRTRNGLVVAAAHLTGCTLLLAANLATLTWLEPEHPEPPKPPYDSNHDALSSGESPPTPYGPLSTEGGHPHAVPSEPDVVHIETRTYLPIVLTMLPMYLLLTIAIQAFLAFGEIKDREVNEARLRGELTRSHLAALRMQVNPHFLFNALNSVSALMATDVPRARAMLADLSTLLRSSFRDSERHEVPLSAELELIEKYVRIQRVRFGERLSLEIEAPQEVRTACVPALSLQPLIENSVVHAVEQCTRPCTIRVTARRDGERLRIEVVDDGPGGTAEAAPGIGLVNTRERLSRMYGDLGTMEILTSPDGGFRVRVALRVGEPPGGVRHA